MFELEKEKIAKHMDGTVKGFSDSYVDNPLNKLDTEFYDIYRKENLQQLQVDYIRGNRSEFIDK